MVDEAAGTWGNAEKIQGLAKLSGRRGSGIASVSCSSTGYCAAVGSYEDSSGNTQAFAVDETAGTWGVAQEIK